MSFSVAKKSIQDLYLKHELRFDILFFVCGFIFDAFMVSEIDDLFSLVQQAVYLLVIAFILHHEILYRLHKWRPSGFFEKAWNYRNLLLHFLLGTLLNIYSLFYIKSASLISSIVFLILLVGLIIANELPFVKKAKVSLKIGLFAICLFSFMSIIYPLILGFVGWTPFGLSTASTLAFFYLQIRFLKSKLPDERTLHKAVLWPGLSVLMIFTLFYFLGWIPPVPLSVKMQGVYHMVEKNNGEYLLSSEKSWWRFWENGDQIFRARPDDKIFFFAQIYSPTRFSDRIFIQWLFKDPTLGWQKTDRIPLQIIGGRKEGFRGFASKSNYQPGDWRIQVETEMGHEISRLGFEVVTDQSQEPRNFTITIK